VDKILNDDEEVEDEDIGDNEDDTKEDLNKVSELENHNDRDNFD
jgi:hypothetical protein